MLNFITTTPSSSNQVALDRNSYDRKVIFKTSWHYFRMTYDGDSLPNTLSFNMDSIGLNSFTTISISLLPTKRYNLVLCPRVPGSATDVVDCDTVIAYVKFWFKTNRRFVRLCDYRMDLEPNIYLRSYWPLVRNDTDSVGELVDLGPYKLMAKINYQN
jgi:hypothetical protein